MEGSTLVLAFFGIQNQLRLYHWSTLSYSRHKASDSFLEEISGLIDKFVEVFMGRYGRIKLGSTKYVVLEDLSDADAPTYLNSFRLFLENDVPKYLKNKDTDLFNIRDEMLAQTKQTLYLFSLN
jgi:hypothetical protein